LQTLALVHQNVTVVILVTEKNAVGGNSGKTNVVATNVTSVTIATNATNVMIAVISN
jgi:hypothetical protein